MQIEFPKSITTIESAKSYLDLLIKHGLDYHMDDDVFDIIFIFNSEYQPSDSDLVIMDSLQDQVCSIDGFCPHEYTLLISKKITFTETIANNPIGFGLWSDAAKNALSTNRCELYVDHWKEQYEDVGSRSNVIKTLGPELIADLELMLYGDKS